MGHTPRYALVVWPDDSMGVVPLEQVDDDVKYRQAIVICREDEACFTAIPDEPSQSNPVRKETDDDRQ